MLLTELPLPSRTMWPRVDGYRPLELGAPGEQRIRLNGLVLHGTKRAAAGIRVEYEDEGEPVERVGEVLVLLDSGRQGIGRLVVTGVFECGFDEVPWDFAEAEGEGFTSIGDWRGRHRRFWEGEGHVVRAETPIVCILFELLTSSCPPESSEG